MPFLKVANFTAKRRKYRIATARRVKVKVANVSVSGKTCMELDIHTDTIVLGKECVETYNCNLPVKLLGCNPKDGDRLFQKISGVIDYDPPQTGQV